MTQVQVTAELTEAQSTVVVSASPDAGGQLLAVDSGAYDVTVRLPQLPIRAKWRVGTSGNWNDLEGGEGFTVSGADSARVYLAKGAAQSASASVTVVVRTVGSFTTGDADVGLVTAQTNPLTGRIAKLLAAGAVVPVNIVLGQLHTQVAAPADTSENILFSLAIPGGVMGPNDALRITLLTAYTNSANLKTVRIRIGGISGALMLNNSMTTTQSCQNTTIIRNRGAVDSQISFAPASTGQSGAQAIANTTASIDMSADQELVVTALKASAGETIALESVLVELICASEEK